MTQFVCNYKVLALLLVASHYSTVECYADRQDELLANNYPNNVSLTSFTVSHYYIRIHICTSVYMYILTYVYSILSCVLIMFN